LSHPHRVSIINGNTMFEIVKLDLEIHTFINLAICLFLISCRNLKKIIF